MRTFAKLALVLVLAGCGASLKTAPVKGQVEFTDGEIAELAESHVELEADDDPTLRGSGVITSESLARPLRTRSDVDGLALVLDGIGG